MKGSEGGATSSMSFSKETYTCEAGACDERDSKLQAYSITGGGRLSHTRASVENGGSGAVLLRVGAADRARLCTGTGAR